MSDSRRNAQLLIEKKWNIEFFWVSGCIVTEELVDSVKKENKKTYTLLSSKYGADWETKFTDDVETEYQIEAYIDSLVKEQPYIKSKEFANSYPGSPFPMYPIDKKGNYIVNVSTYDENWKEQKLYILRANFKTNKITVKTDFTSKQ